MLFVGAFVFLWVSLVAWVLCPARLCLRWRGVIPFQAVLLLGSIMGMMYERTRNHLPVDIAFVEGYTPGLYLDALSLTLLVLIAFMTFIVSGFSLRYLDGEARQGVFMRWLAFTAAAVMLFAATNHLLVFFTGWFAATMGLHRLLVYYHERPGAHRAARQKLRVSLPGALCLIGAFLLMYLSTGALHYQGVFTVQTPSWALNIASFLLVLAAVAKSVQFPFHRWLPESMEAPTPVSAFMHAGIINAGGFLVLRFSPVLVQTPFVLGLLACFGGMTALLGAMMMLTQTTVKKRLAYSTVSQMGFMMLQCGLGAFVAATVHLVAHSLYKAHAFLNSGSLIRQLKLSRSSKAAATLSWPLVLVLAGFYFVLCVLAAHLWGIPLWTQPGEWVLMLVLLMGLLTLHLRAHEKVGAGAYFWMPGVGGLLALFYFGVYHGFEMLLKAVFPPFALPFMFEGMWAVLLVLGFLSLVFLETRQQVSWPVYRYLRWPERREHFMAGRPPMRISTIHPFHNFSVQPVSPHLETLWPVLAKRLAPVWPLEDYVAVNPLMGWAEQDFLTVHRTMTRIGTEGILPTWEICQRAYARGDFKDDHLRAVLTQSNVLTPELSPPRLSLKTLKGWLRSPEPLFFGRYQRLMEWMDAHDGTRQEEQVLADISAICAAYYDQGMTSVRPTPRPASLYAFWRTRKQQEQDLFAQLPADPLVAIESILRHMQVPESTWEEVLLNYLYTMSGWGAWIQYTQPADLCGLLALRLCYEVILWESSGYKAWPRVQKAVQEHGFRTASHDPETLEHMQHSLYLCQQAMEYAYQERLFSKLKPSAPAKKAVKAQFVFCIDVRSERFRRHLEQVEPGLETFGFAGFFAMPIAYRALGDHQFVKHCPAPLDFRYKIEETAEPLLQKQQKTRRVLRKLWKQFKSSAVSCFAFIETVGIGFAPQLLLESLKKVPLSSRNPHLVPDLSLLPLSERVALAQNMLTQLGLTRDFAPLVLLCGHGSTVQNNPFQAAYDCGACCGHSGAPNALMAAEILNDGSVRAALKQKGIAIPENTFFVAACHDTTRDHIRLLNTHRAPHVDFSEVEAWIAKARTHTLKERAALLNTSVRQLLHRSRDISEVRPEWGLAGNAAFVIGQRQSTYAQDLEGRCFLHRYHAETDPEGAVLEGIMTAPMVVTHWINFQYYASSVCPQRYGSGNKTLHNIVGNLGVLEGNSGDLRTGLPFQSVHNGQDLQYAPLRLSVVIEAPRERIETILNKHQHLKDLVQHQWLWLFAYDGGQIYAYAAHANDGEEQWQLRTSLAETQGLR